MKPTKTTAVDPLQHLGFVCSRPHNRLAEVVHSYWQLSGHQPQTQREFLHPDGKISLVFNWGDSQTLGEGGQYAPGANLDPVHSRSVSLALQGNLQCFGVLLQPGVTHRLLDVPASHLGDLHNLDTTLRSQLQSLTQKLSETNGFTSRVALIEDWLYHRLARSDTTLSAARFAITSLQRKPTETNIVQLCSQVNLSRRQLERLMKRDLGLSYKQFQNLLRVRAARCAIKTQPARALSDIALCSGFYDQAHFNRRFTDSMGITPGHYRQLTINPAMK